MSSNITPAAAPPTPQEIQRKLSLHSASSPVPITPGARRRSTQKPPSGTLSSAESDSDGPTASYFSPPQVSAASELSTSPQPPLSVITERRNASGEESDDEEDEEGGEWRPGPTTPEELDESHEETVVKSGYLWKKGERRKTWKKRWFVLRTVKMAYYKNEQEYQLLRLLDLHDVHSVTAVSLKRHTNTFGIVTPTRTFYIQANSPSDCDEWVRALNEVRTRLKDEDMTPSASTPVPSTPREATSSRKPPPPAITTKRSNPQVIVGSSSAYPHSPTSPGGPLSSDSDDPFTAASPPRHDTRTQSNTNTNTSASASASASTTITPSDPKSVILSGYLMKCGSKRKNWRKRWFILTREKLAYSKSHIDTKHIKHIPLDKVIDAIEYDLPAKPHSSPGGGGGSGGGIGGTAGQSATLGVSDSHSHSHGSGGELKNTFKIITTQRPFLLSAPSEEEEIRWLSAVRALIARRS